MMISVVKLATVFEKYNTEEHRSVVRFFNAKDTHKEMLFHVYVGEVCRVRRFTTGPKNSLNDVRKSQMIHDQVRKWLRQQSKYFYAASSTHWQSDGTSVSMTMDMSRNNFSPGSNITCFTFYIHL
jgi:hypothetical protein